MWLIWKKRNGFVFQHHWPKPELIVNNASLLNRNYNQWLPHIKNQREKEKDSPGQWLPLNQGSWKFDVDCSWLNGDPESSIARVFLRPRVEIILSFGTQNSNDEAHLVDSVGGTYSALPK